MPKKKKDISKKVTETQVPVQPKEEAEKPFDFGGLPPRDLKKNLGC
jgi:hypothetical protein